MASLIKNQILKHLTKFFKDLAPEQLQLSAFKGSCELSNLQLEEKVLMELLSFPAWIQINKATCDQLAIKIPWTKIKSVPIQMNLNEVLVEVEVCEEFRDITSEMADIQLTNLINTAQAPGKYGFVDRVIDGITVTVNSVLITFKSKLMSATFNLSRVILESRCPNWKPGELSLTRIKEVNRGEILLFKIAEWQTMRLEAKCLTDPNQAPLRLITNHAQCRLTIKKKLDDCSVVAARIFVIFEDILWVLTFAQFITAASFVEYIFTLIKKSPMSKKTGLLDNQSSPSSSMYSTTTPAAAPSSFGSAQAAPLISPLNTPVHSSSFNQADKNTILTGNMSSASLSEQKFICYDLVETSLHLFIDKVDAHLYDDIEITVGSCSQRDSGGALQTTFDQIQVDCYPYSRAISDRKHWYGWFDPSPQSRKQWLRSHFAEFDLARAQKMQEKSKNDLTSFSDVISDMTGNESFFHEQQVPTVANEQLLSLTLLVKVKDYCMNCVATKHTMRGIGLNKFIQTDKDYHMPSDMPSLYLELNYFYYFDNINRMMVYDNVPDPLAFIHLSPTKLLFDSPTLLFLNSFQVNLSKALVHLNDLFPDDTTAPKIHCRIEILMPQISLPAKANTDQQKKPEQLSETTNTTSTLLVKSGKVTLSNSVSDKVVISKLMDTIEKLRESPSQPINLGSGGYQPSSARREDSCTGDWTKVWNASLINKINEFNELWAIQFEPVWMDFLNYDVDDLASGERLEPIVEPVNAYAFIHFNLSTPALGGSQSQPTTAEVPNECFKLEEAKSSSSNTRDIISILVTVMDGSILANMDKVQFGFLQRLGMHVEKLFQQIRADASSIIQLDTTVEGSLELNLTAYIKDIKARLILDKKTEKQTVLVSIDSRPANREEIQPDLIHKQPIVELPNQVLSGDNKSIHSNSSNNKNSSNYFGSRSTISNPFENKTQLEEGYLGIVYATGEQTSSMIDDGTVYDDGLLDECAEVADDASCLFLGDSSGTTTANKTSGNSDTNKSDSLSVKETRTKSDSRRSPIEESLLINLDEMEQSSALFAKVKLKPQPSPSQQQEPSPATTQHQQEIETESISYLELSMSQLMVRRITETKRRHKF